MSHPEEHVIILEPDHAARTVELLLPQHRDKARILALVKAFAAGAQLAENTAWAVIVGGTLDGAEGVTLDRWGEIVGEMRGGLNHEQYRKFIDLRIRVNSEFPSTDAMWALIRDAVEPSTLASYLVADGIVYLVTSAPFLDDAIAAHTGALVRDFRPMAIYAAVVEQEEGSELEIGTVLDPGSTIGSIADPTGTIGHLIYDGRS